MPVSAEYRKAIEERLGALVPITSRAMFGGVGLYADGLFFALLDDDRIFFKVDETNRGDFEAKGMGPFVPWEGADPMKYWQVPADVWDDDEELKVWVDKAVGVAERVKKPRKKR